MTISPLLEQAHQSLADMHVAMQNDQPLNSSALDAACAALLTALKSLPTQTAHEHVDALKQLQQQIELTQAQAEAYKQQLAQQMTQLNQSSQAMGAYALSGASLGHTQPLPPRDERV